MFGESVNVWAALLLTRADCLHSSSFINSFKKKKMGADSGDQPQWWKQVWEREMSRLRFLPIEKPDKISYLHLLCVRAILADRHLPDISSRCFAHLKGGWVAGEQRWYRSRADGDQEAAASNCYCTCHMSNWLWNQKRADMGVKPSWEGWSSLNL